jgi:prevent-host-death family protein
MAMAIYYGQMRRTTKKTIGAGEFKNRCLEIMDKVKSTGEPIVVTKHGKPVVRIEPAANTDEPAEALRGAILYQAPEIFSTGEAWEADR